MSSKFDGALSFITTDCNPVDLFLKEIVSKGYCKFWDGFYNLNAEYGLDEEMIHLIFEPIYSNKKNTNHLIEHVSCRVKGKKTDQEEREELCRVGDKDTDQ